MRTGDAETYFFYGTLIDPDIRAAVLGRAAADLSPVDDTLSGWRTVFVSGKTYPVIVPSAAHSVRGVRMAIPDPALRQRLRYFEGPEYDIATLKLVSGESANVFVGSKPGRPGSRGWEFDIWQRRHKARFLARIRSAGRA
ncbi:MAG: gamma-glutamylcyclotransferase family protein [Alphaproteobacteria bacterium]